MSTNAPDAHEKEHKREVETPIVQVTPNEVLAVVLIDFLSKLHTNGVDPPFDALVESAWRAETGTSFLPVRNAPSTAIYGPPGHGKSTVCRLVGERIARYLQLEFVRNPPDNFTVTKRHFLFITQEMSGMVSNIEFGGIPTKATGRRPDGSSYDYMAKLLERRIVQLQDAGAGILLLDDFANAATFVQNNLLSIVEEGRFQGLNLGPRVLPLLTGNMGSLDGTHTERISTANISRVRCMYMKEPLDEFIRRTEKDFRNMEFGDAGICDFLHINKSLYDTLDPSGPAGPFACPRTITKTVDSMRLLRRLYSGGRNQKLEIPFLRMVEIMTKSLIGAEAGHSLMEHAYALITEAEPLAAESMTAAGLSAASLSRVKSLVGDAMSAQQQAFAYQFVLAVAGRAAALIAEAPEDLLLLKEMTVRFGRATLGGELQLPDTTRTMALHHFARRLIACHSGFEHPKENGILRPDIAQSIYDAIRQGVSIDSHFEEVIPDWLSGYAFTTGYASRQRVTAPTPRQRP